MTAFSNRLAKNYKHLKTWAQRFSCDAFRVYDKDIPEYAVSVDFYAGKVVIYRYFNPQYQDRDDVRFLDVIAGVKDVFSVEESDIFVKERQRQKGLSQYEKVDKQTVLHRVKEGSLEFIVNLSDYLDTGLFLDHRLSRRWVFENAAGLRVLNLFCYTGSVSVHALGGGASQVVSIDLSSTYLDWAEANLKLNGFDARAHPLIRADVCDWLRRPNVDGFFDLIFLDPPSFSNSKKMKDVFDVQRDHVWMIERCLERLSTKGKLFFSNNLRSFKMDSELLDRYVFEEISKSTLPPDYRNELIHRAWLIEHKPGA
jgi:23S rRNA G2069 N7-methylase RlmK/C1962 C5-methylase RlmI